MNFHLLIYLKIISIIREIIPTRWHQKYLCTRYNPKKNQKAENRNKKASWDVLLQSMIVDDVVY